MRHAASLPGMGLGQRNLSGHKDCVEAHNCDLLQSAWTAPAIGVVPRPSLTLLAPSFSSPREAPVSTGSSCSHLWDQG